MLSILVDSSFLFIFLVDACFFWFVNCFLLALYAILRAFTPFLAPYYPPCFWTFPECFQAGFGPVLGVCYLEGINLIVGDKESERRGSRARLFSPVLGEKNSRSDP
jgi:hypothetical protein